MGVMQQGGLVNNMDWITSVTQQCYNLFVVFDNSTNIVFNHHKMSRNEAMGIGLSTLQCQEILAKVSVNVSTIFFEKVSLSVSAILSSKSISIDISDNF